MALRSVNIWNLGLFYRLCLRRKQWRCNWNLLSAHAEQAVQVPMEAALQAEVEVPMESAMEAEADPHPLGPSKVPRLSVVSSTASEAQELSVGSSTACAAPLQIQLEML